MLMMFYKQRSELPQKKLPRTDARLKLFFVLFYLVGLKLTVRMMSPNTPAAVTPAPAPYPRTVSGIGV